MERAPENILIAIEDILPDWQHGDESLHPSRHVGRAAGTLCPRCHGCLHSRGHGVKDDQAMAALEEVESHRQTHVAKPQEAHRLQRGREGGDGLQRVGGRSVSQAHTSLDAV